MNIFLNKPVQAYSLNFAKKAELLRLCFLIIKGYLYFNSFLVQTSPTAMGYR